jgi:hypothetical protein
MKMEKLMTNKEGEYLYVFDIIQNDKVTGSNIVWSKNFIQAMASAKKRFGNVDNGSFKRLTKDEYSTMIEDQKTKKLDKKRKW